MLKAFGKYKGKEHKMSDPHALAAAFTEIFPDKPLPPDIGGDEGIPVGAIEEIPLDVLESKPVDENISIIE